jgi:flagellin
MALTVNTNMASVDAINQLSSSTRKLAGSFERVASGLRINKAADDAAGLGVAENLSAASQSARQSMRNTNDGISLLQTAEGATSEVSNILKRMRELAIQSSSDTLDNNERAYIEDEFTALVGEVERISQVTEFNGVALTNGSGSGTIDVQVGINNTVNDRIGITMADLRATVLGIDTGSLTLSTVTGARSAIAAFDTALDSVNSYRSGFGSAQNRLEASLRNMEVYVENITAAESRIRDADYAYETAEMAKNQILQQAGISVLSQAKTINQGVLSLLQ